MATPIRMEGADLSLAAVERALREDSNSFEFFTAVRLLTRLRPNQSPPGSYGDPSAEAIRFSVNPSLSYPASEIQSLDMEDDRKSARMSVNFMGLTGPAGVLPYVYSQLVIERLQAGDGAMAAFFDLFHHRLISLFYAAWEKNRFEIRYERTGEDALTRHLLDLIGLGLDSQRRVGPLASPSLAGYAGLLGQEARSAVALEQLVADYFDVPASVDQFVGGWYPVATADQCALDEAGIRSRLGHGTLVGDEVWDPQGRVRLRLGPLTREQFESFLPTGRHHERLATLVRLASHDQVDFEIQLVLVRESVPGLVLETGEDEGQRLGWTTWIRTEPRATDADQTVLRL